MLKILIVEDNLILADILETFLEIGGYEVCGIASTVKEAVSLTNLHKPDIAIFDYRMGGGEYSSQIRPLLRDKTSMGILYASGDPLRGKLTTADGDAYIQKPYGMKDLIQAIRIVHTIKTNGDVSSLPFPRNFSLLRNRIEKNRESA